MGMESVNFRFSMDATSKIFDFSRPDGGGCEIIENISGRSVGLGAKDGGPPLQYAAKP